MNIHFFVYLSIIVYCIFTFKINSTTITFNNQTLHSLFPNSHNNQIPNSLFTKSRNSYINLEDLAYCKKKCEILQASFGCYCDGGCKSTKDCCDLDDKKCKSFYNNNESETLTLSTKHNKAIIGSCCKEFLPLDCFCDEKCGVLKDCCKDYGKCFTNKKIIEKNQDDKNKSEGKGNSSIEVNISKMSKLVEDRKEMRSREMGLDSFRNGNDTHRIITNKLYNTTIYNNTKSFTFRKRNIV